MNDSSRPDKRSRVARRHVVLATLGVALAMAVGTVTSCSSPVANRNPIGERFPEVQGRSLDGDAVDLPPAEPAVLLIGYVQDAQFDADRWLIGLLQAPPAARILEVPTIKGLFPRAFAGQIDSGMRSGIPSEDWSSVVTVYGEGAADIVAFTGNEKPRNIRVLLTDSSGRVRWYHDRGFSAAKLLELGEAVRTLESASND